MNLQLKALGQVTENLEAIRAFRFPECPHAFAAVQFRFPSLSIIVGVDADTDEIVFLDEIPADTVEVTDSSALNFLKRAEGRHFGWVWRMENQQGSFDGIQFCLILDESSEPPFVFQLEAAGSTLHLCHCATIKI